jgi:LuxR family transcriptional regulator, quorum-sensing system regulator SinR
MRMTPLKLDLAHRLDIGFRPQVMEPMFQAADSGKDLSPAIARIVSTLGFESFMYGLCTTIRPGRASQVYFYATLPRAWSLLYEEKNYVEIDPRIAVAQDQCGPAPWDRDIAMQITPPKQHAKLGQFLKDASAYGIRSGVAWGVRNPGNHGVIVGLNCPADTFGTAQRDRLARNIGDVLAFGTYFHEFFIHNFVDRGMPSRLRGAALTEREIEVLGLVARGLTAEDIALKLEIVARTVRFHVDSARTKMGALNREEAIALVARAGLISILP